LAGATARDILMWHLHDIRAPVATRDVDVAVCAVSWESHDALIELLVQTQRFRRHSKQQQKLLFKRSAEDYEGELDIVPFGQIEGPPGEIHWPPDGDIVMTVLGFQEAVDTAQPVSIGEGLVVPVVTLPAFVLLKLIAWKDRRLTKNTDSADLLFEISSEPTSRRRTCSRPRTLMRAWQQRGCSGATYEDLRIQTRELRCAHYCNRPTPMKLCGWTSKRVPRCY
ncbi:hypothetical protein GSH05_34835, partial [Burkholderia pseudomallei]